MIFLSLLLAPELQSAAVGAEPTAESNGGMVLLYFPILTMPLSGLRSPKRTPNLNGQQLSDHAQFPGNILDLERGICSLSDVIVARLRGLIGGRRQILLKCHK